MVENLPEMQETLVGSLGWKDPLEEEMATHSRESHGQRSLAGCSPWGHKESDTTEQLTHTHTFLFIHGAYDSGISCLTSFLEEEKKEQTREGKAVGL